MLQIPAATKAWLAAAIRILLASAFLLAVASVTVYNVRQLQDNPELGTKYVYSRRAELIREIEGVAPPTKETLINLALGDGMRFVNFLADNLPEDTSVIFPANTSGSPEASPLFRYAGPAHFIPYFYPRKFQTETYDFETLPYNPRSLSTVPQEYHLVTRDYTHSSRHWVFQIFGSPDSKRYRFYFKTYPVQGQKNYHTENLLVAYPEGLNP